MAYATLSNAQGKKASVRITERLDGQWRSTWDATRRAIKFLGGEGITSDRAFEAVDAIGRIQEKFTGAGPVRVADFAVLMRANFDMPAALLQTIADDMAQRIGESSSVVIAPLSSGGVGATGRVQDVMYLIGHVAAHGEGTLEAAFMVPA